MTDQVLSLFAAKNGYMNDVPAEDVASYEKNLHREFHENHKDICYEIENIGVISKELTEKIHAVMKEVLQQYTLVKGVN